MRAFISLAVTLLVAGCVHGQMGPGAHAGMGQHRMQMAGAMGPMAGCPGAHQDAEARLAALRSALTITSTQEPAWNAYATAYRQHAAAMPMRAGMGAGHMAGPAPERMRHHEEMMASHLESMRALRARLEALYAVLTPEQRAAGDAMRCEGMHER